MKNVTLMLHQCYSKCYSEVSHFQGLQRFTVTNVTVVAKKIKKLFLKKNFKKNQMLHKMLHFLTQSLDKSQLHCNIYCNIYCNKCYTMLHFCYTF